MRAGSSVALPDKADIIWSRAWENPIKNPQIPWKNLRDIVQVTEISVVTIIKTNIAVTLVEDSKMKADQTDV